MAEQVIFDHYEVVHRDDGSLFELGRGAMGITYKAIDTNLQIPVALKVINATSIHSDLARQRFVREARAAAKLRHRHVASVFHLGIEGDTYFYAMEFIDGETVESLIRRQGPLDPVLALRIATQVARALNAAQQHELVHRDIKPSNLMLVHEDDELMAKVIDFGLAKSSRKDDGADAAELSMTGGGFVGTPHFASPEQLEEKDIDVRSDIYSLGVTLWYMLAGRAPFAGSVAQVMSQHLHDPVPLDQLAAPPAVLSLLGRMLEKDPARRPQTPVELRQELEKCIAAVAGSAPEAAEPTLASERSETKYPTQFHAGTVIAGRYELTEAQGEGHAGKIFRARQVSDGTDVRLILLNPDLVGTSEAYTQLERELDKVSAIEHRNLLRVFAFERVGEASVLVIEATRGFTLIEVLRARRELESAEAVLLLKQAAVAIDHAVQGGLKRLDLALHQIAIHFPEAKPEPRLLNERLSAWPEFLVKLNPLGITRELSMSETWTGEQTIVGDLPGGARDAAATVSPMTRYVQALAAIIYECLGGTASPLLIAGIAVNEAPRYVPLAGLSEAGNEALKRALDPQRSFASAQEFYHALRGAEAGTAAPGSFSSPATRAPLSMPAPTLAPAPVPTRMAAPPAPVQGHGLPLAVKAGVPAAIVLLGLLAYFALRPSPPKPEPGASTTATTTSPAPAATISRPPAVARTSPTPSRQDRLKARVAEAERYEAAQDWARCLPAYAAIAREFPESETGRIRLEMVLSTMRDKFEKQDGVEFEALRPAIEEAAKLGGVSAMMILGERLRKKEPKEAFNWFCAAAALGHTPAFTQVGLMYSNGAGVAADLGKALWWFQQASDRGDAGGKTCLAECALYGRGMRRDEKRAIEILHEAVALGDPRAMNLLGTCFHQGLGGTKNFEEALRLFGKAFELGFLDAAGNLGVLYMNGDGVIANPAKAIELFQQGARENNAYCMYLYARCLESGNGIAANAVAAESWYKKSAALGNPRAIEWCRSKRVDFAAEAAR